MNLHNHQFSLDHDAFCQTLAQTENLLIIQDLDGVCMELVEDPLTRRLEPDYVQATTAFAGHFYVLTNGEHIGKRGVQGIVERAFGDGDRVKQEGLYLPGLAGGGVQWQDRQGQVSHPGVSEAELRFLAAVPQRLEERLREFFRKYPAILSPAELERGIQLMSFNGRRTSVGRSVTDNFERFLWRICPYNRISPITPMSICRSMVGITSSNCQAKKNWI